MLQVFPHATAASPSSLDAVAVVPVAVAAPYDASQRRHGGSSTYSSGREAYTNDYSQHYSSAPVIATAVPVV